MNSSEPHSSTPTTEDPTLETLFAPAEFEALDRRDLSQTVCVVFDVLRATSSMVTALHHGALGIQPVAEIAEAIEIRRRDPEVLLAGEREGLRIRAAQTGSIDFDYGNSPREFAQARVSNRRLVMTTTNGTRALRACAGARRVLIGSFLNLSATANWVLRHRPSHLLLICSGTFEQAALEDLLAAGALAGKVWRLYAPGRIADSAEIARQLYSLWELKLLEAMTLARNGRRLLANPELRADVPFCLQSELVGFAAGMGVDGWIQKLND